MTYFYRQFQVFIPPSQWCHSLLCCYLYLIKTGCWGTFQGCTFFFFFPVKIKTWVVLWEATRSSNYACLQFLQTKIKISINVLLCAVELSLFPTYNERLMPACPVPALCSRVNDKVEWEQHLPSTCFSTGFLGPDFNQSVVKLKHHRTLNTVLSARTLWSDGILPKNGILFK